MKTKHILGSLAIVAIAGLSSCDLTMLPETSVTPDLFFQTGSDLELWTNQYYTMFDEADGAAGTNADDMIDKSMGKVIEGTRNPQGSDGWSWTTLRSINEYMANSGRCADEAARLKYDGVARFFRAYFYFLKVRMFGDVPYYDQVIGSEDQALLNRPRDPRDYVMGKVLDDLRFAITNLPEKDDVTRLTKWAALGFATRIALYEGTFRKYHGIADYQKYLQFADSCGNVFINGSSYKLVSAGNEPYRDLFCADKADATEVVLARAYDFEGLSLSHGVQCVISNM
ncbi:MAG: RagB/SusD family nutrient uptake outer membrane protein, partial [Muribaculaceae bacterium]|nr:RagB/SusD family nutrient uptake outer membrane protein [Muribaculaceae bacterium]